MFARFLFWYFSRPQDPMPGDTAVVFGRKDKLLAEAVLELVEARAVIDVVISGGVGKDSGDLAMPEAEYVDGEFRKLLEERCLTFHGAFLEKQAKHGVENAFFSLGVIRANWLGRRRLVAVAHATSARRLARTLRFAAKKTGFLSEVGVYPTSFQFDPANKQHRKEVWYELGWMIGFPLFVRKPNLVKYLLKLLGM